MSQCQLFLICCELLLSQRRSQYMDKLKKLFENPLQLTLAASGISLIAFYLLYARHRILQTPQSKIPQKSSLELSLQQLLKQKHPNICKIVITESLNTKSPFKGHILTRLKQFLLSQNLHVLVNCAPLKLFNASVQIFVSTLSKDDAEDQKEFMNYFQNALKCQLLIQRTVLDIQRIKNTNQRVFLLCDTNSFDLQAHADTDLWKKFLTYSKISQPMLQQNYQIVFHVPNTELTSSPKLSAKKKSINELKYINEKSDDQKIKETWKGFNKYYEIIYDPQLDMKENVENSVQKMVGLLKEFLPEGVVYQKSMSEYSHD